MALMEEIAAKTPPPGAGFEWTAMSYQEKVLGGRIYWAFGLVPLVLAIGASVRAWR